MDPSGSSALAPTFLLPLSPYLTPKPPQQAPPLFSCTVKLVRPKLVPVCQQARVFVWSRADKHARQRGPVDDLEQDQVGERHVVGSSALINHRAICVESQSSTQGRAYQPESFISSRLIYTQHAFRLPRVPSRHTDSKRSVDETAYCQAGRDT